MLQATLAITTHSYVQFAVIWLHLLLLKADGNQVSYIDVAIQLQVTSYVDTYVPICDPA